MKFVRDSSSGKYSCYENNKKVCEYVEINTLGELIEYTIKEGHPVIISIDDDGNIRLETYDDYRE